MRKIFKHLLLPIESNNYRAKLLHPKSLIFAILLVFSLSFLIPTIKSNFPSVLGTYSDISQEQLTSLTNQKRQEYGLSALSLNPQLSLAAQNKATDMFVKDYWAHNSPDGVTPWVFIKGSGYNYIYAGENLARGFNSAPDVINAWMASPEHKQNMLSPNYTDVGFAVMAGKLTGEDTVLIVQMFGSRGLSAPVGQTQKTVEVAVKPAPRSETTQPAQIIPASINNPSKLVLEAQKNPLIRPLFNSSSLSINIAKTLALLFISILILDMIFVERRKIIRFVGHNLDHIIFFALILGLIVLFSKGVVI